VLSVLAIACDPPPRHRYFPPQPVEQPLRSVEAPPPPPDPATAGVSVDRSSEFVFDGGEIEFELRQDGNHVYQLARSHYAVPLMMQWQLDQLSNLEPTTAVEGVALLPAADAPGRVGPPVLLAEMSILDTRSRYRRAIAFHARFGDPRAQPTPYRYGLPYGGGRVFAVLQGFHGEFSHRGSNEYAVDFDCPVATPVIATRPGVVVAVNASAQGSGTTSEFLEYKRVNFVLVRHDDGTLGEYMHLSPSGVEVKPGQVVKRGQELALSGNTGFSSTPHLHFQVMTAAQDGVAARSFPFRIAVAPGRVEEPIQGRSYTAWE
jgi:murein DD-endopeptidase MepM/ murein hydrolase activator NlpD